MLSEAISEVSARLVKTTSVCGVCTGAVEIAKINFVLLQFSAMHSTQWGVID